MYYYLYVQARGLAAAHARQTLGIAPEKPCVVHHQGRVVDADPGALARQVHIGTPLKEAKTILRDDAAYVEEKPEDFIAVRDSFLAPALLYTDQIQSLRPGEALLDITPHPRPAEIAGELLRELHRPVKHLATLHASLAPAVWIARLAARPCDPAMLNLGLLPLEAVLEPAAWLAPLPVAVLTPLPPSDRQRLRRLGFDKVSQVQSAPLARLEEQFPGRGLLVRQTSLGHLHDPLRPDWPGSVLSRTLNLQESTDLLELDTALARLSRTLCADLCARDLQAGTVRLTVVFAESPRQSAHRPLAKPVVAASQLHTVLRQLLQSLGLKDPVDALVVQLSDLKPSTRRQTSLALASAAPTEHLVQSTVRRLDASFGTGTVRLANTVPLDYQKQVLQEWKHALGWK